MRQSVFFSLLFHLLFFLLIEGPAWVKRRFFSSSDISLEVVALNSVKVDLVGMPKLTLEELKALSQESLEKREEKKTTKEFSKEKEKSQEKKSISILEEAIQKKEALKKILLEGNKLSKGNLLYKLASEKETSSLQETEYQEALNFLVMAIKQEWFLPPDLIGEQLQAKISLKISTKGKIQSFQLSSPSGNKNFDERALSSVELAKTKVQLEEKHQEILKNKTIILVFPL